MSDSPTNSTTASIQINRRIFLAGGLAAAGSMFTGTFNAEKSLAANKVKFDADALRKAVKCEISVAGESNFKDKVYGGLWNRLYPNRAPQVVVNVATDADVMAAVKFAKANGMKVAIRGGGHNWCSPSLRNGGMMIDLTLMNKIISIDEKAKIAIVEPILSNREVQKALNDKGLAFPTGHCPQVKMSGYLLSGGMAWNQGTWGPGVGSVEKIELVTADGELIVADKDNHQDYFWAARGAGSGMFAVAVRYHLKLYDLPKAIVCSSYYYPLDQAEAVASWIKEIAPKMDSCVELSYWLATAPDDLKEQTKGDNGKCALVTATAFVASQEQGNAVLAPLDTCPVIGKCIKKPLNQLTTFSQLFDFSGALWQADMRNQVEAMFSNSDIEEIIKATKQHFKIAPSAATVFMYAVFTGKDVPAKLPDACFSMSAKLYGGPWTMWKNSADDQVNIEWHKKMLTLLAPFTYGHYVSETDTITYPAHLSKSYTPAHFKRLNELRKKYDPTGVFFKPGEAVS